MKRRPTQEHTIEKKDGGFRCTTCHVTFKSHPYHRKDCQGIPRYNVRKERPKHLFTENELAKRGKRPNSEPEGYVKMLNAPYWVYLYDISKAIPLEEVKP